MSSGDDQRMDIDVDEPELQRNRKEESAISSMANSDSANDSFIDDTGLFPLTPEMLQALYSEDVIIQLKATEKIGKLLLESPNPHITQVIKSAIIKSGSVPRFVHFIEDFGNPKLQFESAWVLTNIASGNSAQTQVVIDAGAVPVLIGLLSSPNVIAYVLPQACWALAYLGEGSNEQIQVIIDSGLCPRVVQLLSHCSTDVVKAALHLVFIITTGDDSQIQFIINAIALPVLHRLMFHQLKSIVMEACLTLSNITASNEQQIQAVLDGELFSSLIKLLHHRDVSVRKEAMRAITNATAKGSEEQILCIVEAGVIPLLCKLLSETHSTLIKFTLRSLVNILRTGESFTRATGSTVNPFATLICNSPPMRLALDSEDTAIRLDATKRFRKLLETSEGFTLLIDEVIKMGAVPRFVHFLEATCYPELQLESAWVLTNITSGNSAQTQVVIDAGAVPVLIKLLTSSSNKSVVKMCVQALRTMSFVACLLLHEKESIVMEACLTLASITAGNETQIQAVIDCNLIPSLLKLLIHRDVKIGKSAAWALANATSNGSEKQIVYIVEAGAIAPLCKLLTETDWGLIKSALICLENILRTGKGISNADNSTENPYATLVKQCAGFDKIAFLSSHNDPKIKEAALTIIKMLSGSKLKYLSG